MLIIKLLTLQIKQTTKPEYMIDIDTVHPRSVDGAALLQNQTIDNLH